MNINILIPTFEPSYRKSNANKELRNFYQLNFLSWIKLSEKSTKYNVKVIIADFKSSYDFRIDVLKILSDNYDSIIPILGINPCSSTNAINTAIEYDKKADIYIYAASDTRAEDLNWFNYLEKELIDNPSGSIFYSTCYVDGSEPCNQKQSRLLDKPAKKLLLNEQPNPHVVVFRRELLKAYQFRLGNIEAGDLGLSFAWLALSIDTSRYLSYRLFIEHNNFLKEGRHYRGGIDAFVNKKQRRYDLRMRRRSSEYIHLFEGYSPPDLKCFSFKKLFSRISKVKSNSHPLIRLFFFSLITIPFLIEDIYVCTGLSYHMIMIEKLGFWNYLFQKSSSERKIGRFIMLDNNSRIELCKAAFFVESPLPKIEKLIDIKK
tara:strand:+ start:1677 stop:2801 length:1125 start_codon:yes stop_codon:yes gene_type:complete